MSSKIKIAIAAVLVIALIVVAVVLLTGGGDDDDNDSSGKATSGQKSGDDSGSEDSKSQPALRTVAIKRGEGQNASVAAGGIIDKPKGIYLRVSAAPKQSVKGSWNVSCGGGAVDMDTFTATPPYLLKLPIPRKNASCVAGASAQLSGKGRLKVAILRER